MARVPKNPQNLPRSWISRGLFGLLTGIALVLAIVGAFLPGLPTTVFLIIAAWAAARCSPRLHAWLLEHRLFGRLLTDWNNGQRVSRHAKITAAAVMTLCAAWLLYAVEPKWLAAIPIVIMASVLTWLWRRPEPTPPDDTRS